MPFFIVIPILLFVSLLIPLYTCLHISTPLDNQIDDQMQENFLRDR